MWWAFALCSALAGEQEIAELEWTRAAPLALVAELPAADGPTRARIAIALGRARDPRAIEILAAFADDVDPGARRAAAQALGWVPGSADALRGWLLAVPAGESPPLRADLVRSLGMQGSSRDLALLLDALDEPAPVGEAAALALGTLGQRQVPALDGAVPRLVARLQALDGRVVDASAFALRRIQAASWSPDDVERALAAARSARSPTARARLIQALWPHLQAEQKDALFIEGMTGTSRQVRVALLDAVGPDDMPGDVLQAWLVDRDPWVRSAALRALGRVGDVRDLQPLADDASQPWRAAAAVEALGEGSVEAARDASLPPPLRAAHAAVLTDPEALAALIVDEEPVLRSAAALAIVALEDRPDTLDKALWASDDPLVREVATLPVAETAPVQQLLDAAVREAHPEVLASMAEALVARVAREPRAVRANDPRLGKLVEATAAVPTLRGQQAAMQLCLALGLPEPTPLAPSLDGLDWPDLTEVRRIREARVHTAHGDFVLQLDPHVAPLAVHAFAGLAEQGFFDGLVMHRMVPGFVVQGGDPRGDGWGGPGFALPDEVSALPFDEGALGMARGGPDTGGSQWFVTTAAAPHLVGAYTRFGEVVQGMDRVARLPAGTVIESITVVRTDDDGG